MRCMHILVLFAVICGISSQDDRTRENKCIVPPKDIIKNGKFKFSGYDDDKQPLAGEKLYSYVMEVTCDPGFTRQGLYLVQCITDKSIDTFPKCIAPCQRQSPDVLSCGTGFDNEESQCLLSKPQEKLTTRIRTDLQCGVIPQIFRATVSNGTKAKPEDAPWHATIYTKTTKPYMQICGGTIVSTKVVISAAHCFWNNLQKRLPTDQFAVAVGKIYRPWDDPNDSGAQKFEIKDIRIPPRFQGSTTNFQDDIAILILETDINFGGVIWPACLDFDYDFDDMQIMSGRTGRVSGFGLTSADGAASQVLIWAELPVVGIEQCIATAEPGFIGSITSDKICAGFNNGTAVCRGDSGGGLLIPDDVEGSRRYFLRGVVSTAPTNDHLCNVYAVATFTHVIRHERFIRSALEVASQSQLTTTEDPLQKHLSIANPVDDTDELKNPAANPLTNSNKQSDNDETTTENIHDLVQKIKDLYKTKPVYVHVEPTKKPCEDLPPGEKDNCYLTSTQRDEIAYQDSIFKTTVNPILTTEKSPVQTPNKPTCDNVPDEELLNCIFKKPTTTSKYIPEELDKPFNDNDNDNVKPSTEKSKDALTTENGNSDDNKSSSNDETMSKDENDNINSNIGTQIFTEAAAPITNPPPTFNNEQNFGPDDFNLGEEFESLPTGPETGPNLDNFNQGGIELPNQRDSSLGEPIEGNINNSGNNQGSLVLGISKTSDSNKGGANQSGSKQEGSNEKRLNQGNTNLGGLNHGGFNQGGINHGGISQGVPIKQGNQNAGQQRLQNQIGINGQINQGSIIGGINQNLAGQLGLHVGGFVQEPHEGDKVHDLNQGLANQLGLNYGGNKHEINVGTQGQTQTGIQLGVINQFSMNQGNQGGMNQHGLNHGFLSQPVTNGQAQAGINSGELNQSSQTFKNQGGQTNGGINVGGYTYLPAQPIKNNGQHGHIIPDNVEPKTKIELKPILTHPESSTESIDVKTSVLEQYFMTTEPNYQNNYQTQFWQYNSPHYQHDYQNYQHNKPNYQHNNQNWQWQNWQQKQHDWQNWNPQWEHKQELPHGYYHHTNKYGGHWWQKYHQ